MYCVILKADVNVKSNIQGYFFRAMLVIEVKRKPEKAERAI